MEEESMLVKAQVVRDQEIMVSVGLGELLVQINPQEVLAQMDSLANASMKKTAYLVHADAFAIECICAKSTALGHVTKSFSSYTVCVGHILKEQVRINLEFYRIGDAIVCFWRAVSDFSHKEMVRIFFQTINPKIAFVDGSGLIRSLFSKV